MPGETRSHETQAAESILHEFGITDKDKLPVDIDAILAAKGFAVSERDLPEDVAAVLDTRTAGKPILLVDKALDSQKKRFVKACELGHFLLDGNFAGVRMDKKGFLSQSLISSAPADETDRRANRFAYALLMPKKILEEQAQENNGKSDDDFARTLATIFGVSAVAVAVGLVIFALAGDKGKKK